MFKVDFVAQQDSDVCECVTEQVFVALLLVVNFAVNVAETEISNMDTEMSNAFDIVDHIFTIFYVLELLLNLFVNWFWPFISNGWSVFDFFSVVASLAGLLINLTSKDARSDLSVIRSVRMYVEPLKLFPHSAPCTAPLDCDSPPDNLRTRIPCMLMHASLFVRFFLMMHEVMLNARDFLVCAPARVSVLCFCVSVCIRSFKILKIVRVFARLKSLQRIVMATASTGYPLANTFIIFAVVVSIFSVLAQTLYGKLMTDEFGTFSRSVLTMCQICTADGWMTAIVRPLIALGVEDGQVGFAVWTSAFFICYILLVYVVLLNVSVAVLLEGFLSHIADDDLEIKAKLAIKEYAKISGSLDPLIASFSSFDSTDQLHHMIVTLFKHLDVDSSNSLSFMEFKDGLEALNMQPALHVTEEDWNHFTGHGKFLDDAESLDIVRFEQCMREELKGYSQRIISHQMRQATIYCKENSLDYFAHKMQMAEVYSISNRLSDLICDLKSNEQGFSLSNDVSGKESLAKNRGEGEWKEVRDLLQQLAAEQKELRMGQQRLEEKLEAHLGESGPERGNRHGENGEEAEVGVELEERTVSPGEATHEKSPALTISPSRIAASEQEGSAARKSLVVLEFQKSKISLDCLENLESKLSRLKESVSPTSSFLVDQAKLWRHRNTGAHLSTNLEQTLRWHDAGRAADCRQPQQGGVAQSRAQPPSSGPTRKSGEDCPPLVESPSTTLDVVQPSLSPLRASELVSQRWL